MTIIWKDKSCSSTATTQTGHKLSAESITGGKWLWFVQQPGSGAVTDSTLMRGWPPETSRQRAKMKAYDAFLQTQKI